MLLNWLFYFVLSVNNVHDLPVATYNLSISDFEIDIEIEFHQTDLQHVLNAKHLTLNEESVSNYITENIKWIINGKAHVLQFCSFHLDDYHYIIKAHINIDQAIKNIEIFNNCLINEIADHSNVTYLYQKGKEVRGFRSHKGRQTLFIDL